ncbi:glycosyltransferase family 39 protein [Magnetococcus sp. PR-3]|uniref:glycosyltransferase family 39 protein n=1 Tax=Magnetococcus sp. PR-3 TaxID=3120355 RepID=UPI002FCE25E6
MPYSSKIHHLIVLILCTLFVAVASTLVMGGAAQMGSDALPYLVPVYNWIQGDGYRVFGVFPHGSPPGYGLATLLTYPFVGRVDWAGITLSLFAYGSTLLVLGSLYQKRFGFFTALLALLTLGLMPGMVNYSVATLAESLFVALLVTSVVCALKVWDDPEQSTYSAIALGLILGFGNSVRPEMLPIAGLMMLILLARHVFHKQQQRWRGPIIWTIAIFVSLFIANILFIHSHTDKLALHDKSLARIMPKVERVMEGKPSPAAKLNYQVSTLEYFRLLGWETLKKRLEVGFWRERHIIFGHLKPILLIWSMAGLVMLWRYASGQQPKPNKQNLFFWLPLGLLTAATCFPLLVYPFYYVNARFLHPSSVMLALMFIVMAGSWLQQITHHRSWRFKSLLLGLCVTVLLVGYTPALQKTWNKAGFYTSHEQAGEWIHKQGLDVGGIISPYRTSLLHFYASGRALDLAPPPLTRYHKTIPSRSIDWKQPLPSLVNILRGHKMQHLVLTTHRLTPPLQALWADPAIASEAGLLLQHQTPRFQVYTLNPKTGLKQDGYR